MVSSLNQLKIHNHHNIGGVRNERHNCLFIRPGSKRLFIYAVLQKNWLKRRKEEIMVWIIIASFLLYAVLGFLTAWWYGKKLEELKKQLIKNWKMEFNLWKMLRWIGLSLVAWWFVLPYELVTNFKQWRYPYCAEDL